jgi:hypothetical protein
VNQHRHLVGPRLGRVLVLASLLAATQSVGAQVFTDTFNNGSVPDADTRPGFWNQVIDGNGTITETSGIPGVTLRSQSGGPGNSFPFTELASPLQNDFNFFRSPIRIRATGLGYAAGDSPLALTQFTLTSQALDSAGPLTEYQAQDAFTIWVTNRTTANNGTGYGTLLMGIKQDSVNRSTAFEGYPLLGPIGNVASTQVYSGQVRSFDLHIGATFFYLSVTHDTSPTNSTPIIREYRAGLDVYRVNSPYLANWATPTNTQGDSAFNIQTQLNNVPSVVPVANFKVGSVTVDKFARSFIGGTFANWSSTTSWTDPAVLHRNADNSESNVPNFVGAAVRFPQTSSPTTVIADLDFTLGNHVIDSTQPYTLTVNGGGQGTLNLASRYPLAEVTVANGSGHVIFNPIIFRTGSDALLTAESPTSSLTLPYATLEFPTAQTLTKIGPGRIDVGSVSSASLTVSGGTLRMLPQDGTYPGMFSGPSVVATLALTGGLLDLTSNDLIVQGGDLAALRASVASWWNNGARNGAGLGSSLSTALSFTTLAVRTPLHDSGLVEIDTFSGLPVVPSDVLVKYTYLGDTNLDGVLDASDFNAVLSGVTNSLSGWQNGDLNYDGLANAADLALFLPAYAHYQSNPIPLGGTGPAGAIPEPAATLPLLLATPLLLRRKR